MSFDWEEFEREFNHVKKIEEAVNGNWHLEVREALIDLNKRLALLSANQKEEK